MLDICSFTPLPEDEDAPRRKAPAKFRRLVHAYNGRARLPLLSRKYERELIGLVQDTGCQDSTNILVESHIGFITNIAQRTARFSGLHDHVEDLYDEACAAFIKSIGKFRLKRQVGRLANYAQYRVIGDCLRYAMDNKYPYRFGTNLPDKLAFYELPRLRKRFLETHGRPMGHNPSDALLAEHLCDLKAEIILRAQDAERGLHAMQIDEIQIHEPGRSRRAEVSLMDSSRTQYLEAKIAAYAETLQDRDKDIVLTVTADPDARAELMELCAARHEISVERVRQIYRGALADIREALAEDGYSSFADIA